MKSVRQKIQQCEGLIDTRDVNDWENGFLKGLAASTTDGDTTHLTQKQVEVLERIYGKHFA